MLITVARTITCAAWPQVEPGQEYVQDEAGNVFQVVWFVDDSGQLVVQETKPAPAGAQLANQPSLAPSGALPGTTYPAVNGRARIPLPGNVLMEVRSLACSRRSPSTGPGRHAGG